MPAYLAGIPTRARCEKIAYPTRIHARLRVLWSLDNEGVYLGEYPCTRDRKHDGPVHWHVFSLTKAIDLRREKGQYTDAYERCVAYLRDLCQPDPTRHPAPVDLAESKVQRENRRLEERQALRELNRKLAVFLHSMSRDARLYGYGGGATVRTQRFRRRKRDWFRWHYRGKNPVPRRDLPRGETVTKMLAWPNGLRVGYNRRFLNLIHQGELARRKSDLLRRRNRAREKEALRRELRNVI